MKLDFHTHGKLAKRLPFSTTYTDWLFGEAKAAGLSALCLTEHFNTLQFDELYAYLARKSRREGDTLVLPNGLRVFPGMETILPRRAHPVHRPLGGHFRAEPAAGSLQTTGEFSPILKAAGPV